MSFSAWLSTHYEEQGPVKWLAFFLEVIAALTLLLLMLLTCTDVLGRYLFDNSLDAASELTEICIAIIVFAEMPIITWRGGHVVVDILDRFIGKKVIKVLAVFSIFVMSSSLYYVAHRMFFMAERSLRRGEESEYLAIPMGHIVQYIAIMSWITAGSVITYGLYILLFPRTTTPPADLSDTLPKLKEAK
ncbi:MAG: TRAP transporter small permease [Colwellia sp.]|nr:TRAP transporter small permease [Colwellia sp.]